MRIESKSGLRYQSSYLAHLVFADFFPGLMSPCISTVPLV
jgi:hypothetical protein